MCLNDNPNVPSCFQLLGHQWHHVCGSCKVMKECTAGPRIIYSIGDVEALIYRVPEFTALWKEKRAIQLSDLMQFLRDRWQNAFQSTETEKINQERRNEKMETLDMAKAAVKDLDFKGLLIKAKELGLDRTKVAGYKTLAETNVGMAKMQLSNLVRGAIVKAATNPPVNKTRKDRTPEGHAGAEAKRKALKEAKK